MSDVSLDQRLRELAREQPNRSAITAIDVVRGTYESLTWHQVDYRTSQISSALCSAERAPASQPIVWTKAENAIKPIVSLLGALRSGHVIVPLDHLAPKPDRARQLTAIARAYGPASSLADLLAISQPQPQPQVQSKAEVSTHALGAGWILMTGGTTGVPRPVKAISAPTWNPTHPAPLLLQHAQWRPGQAQLILGPLHHAAPFTSFIYGILSGNATVVTSGYDPRGIFDIIGDFGVEWVQLTPVHMRMAEPLLERHSGQLNRLRAVLHTGAPCPSDTKRAWIGAIGADRIFEMYAATEGIGTTLCTGAEWLKRPGTVGRGFMTRIRIEGPRGAHLPAGQVGEIYMRSALPSSVAADYPGSRPFRSVGDRGMLDKDGYLYVRGRQDDLVIVGGENVFTGEVVSEILTHEEVADAAVIGVPDEAYGATLCAYVVLRPSAAVTESDLRRHCRNRLPPSKVPKALRIVPELPRNAAMKLLRHELHTPQKESVRESADRERERAQSDEADAR